MVIWKKEIVDLKKWHIWYAWYPVQLRCGRVVWLEKGNRRQNEFGDEFHYDRYWGM